MSAAPFVSKVQRPMESSRSLRVTVPEAVAAILGIQQGDSIEWFVEGPARVVVRKQTSAVRRR